MTNIKNHEVSPNKNSRRRTAPLQRRYQQSFLVAVSSRHLRGCFSTSSSATSASSSRSRGTLWYILLARLRRSRDVNVDRKSLLSSSRRCSPINLSLHNFLNQLYVSFNITLRTHSSVCHCVTTQAASCVHRRPLSII